MRFLAWTGGAFAPLVAAALAPACGGSAFQTGGATADAGTLEAAATDTGAPIEAGAEAGTSYCATTPMPHTFCEDFDEYPSVQALVGGTATWSPVFTMNGSFQFDTVMPPSAPNALEAVGDDAAQVILVKSFARTGALKNARLAFDLRIDSPGAPGLLSAAGFAAIAFGSSLDAGYVAVAIVDGPQLAVLAVPGTSTGAPLDAGLPKPALAGSLPALGQWAGTYTIEVDYSVTPAGCAQLYAGAKPLLDPCMALPSSFVDPKVVSVAVGDVAGGAGKTGSIAVEFDDLTFDLK
jgi:hypothetical protein